MIQSIIRRIGAQEAKASHRLFVSSRNIIRSSRYGFHNIAERPGYSNNSSINNNNTNNNMNMSNNDNNNSFGMMNLQRRGLFIQTEDTPNPESIKFLPGREVLSSSLEDVEGGGESVGTGFYAVHSDREEIARSPLAKRLFQIEGCKSVYFGADFVTVTKFAEANWSHMRTLLFSSLMDFYASGEPALTKMAAVTDTQHKVLV